MSNFAEFKKKRKNVADIVKKLDDANEKKKKDYTDERQYKYIKDKSGNSFSVIRFLPSKNDTANIVSTYSHGFQHRGKWFIEECLTTIKGKCPVCENNSQWFADGASEADKNIGRSRSRRKNYVANIYVVKDSAQPHLEGKVMLWKFGQKVYDKIKAKLKPEFEGEEPVEIFDYWKGADFKLKIKTVAGYSNYDGCEFSPVNALLEGDDKKLEEVHKSLFDLSEFIDPTKFKSYDDVKKKLEYIIGNNSAPKDLSEKEESREKDSTANEEKEEVKSEESSETDEFFEDFDK
jgi:hypothetical protein